MAELSEILIPELTLYKRGKVRDVYEVEDKLLVVASDPYPIKERF